MSLIIQQRPTTAQTATRNHSPTAIIMAASRVETEPKPRWLEPKYKPDLKKYPEEVTKLCPIVITTIAAAPMRGGHDDFEFDRTH